MREEIGKARVDKLFSRWTLGLCVFGLAINLILSKLVIFLGLPLYIDNVGSVLVGALGGVLPGMAVGFLSNLVGSISQPISLYYGILTVIMAWLASVFSRRGLFKRWYGILVISGCYICIGGAVGSVMTWFLYGGGIGGIAAPYATFFFQNGFPEFWAQFTADVLIDIPDKFITVGLVCLALHYYPKKLYDVFPLSYLYDRSAQKTRIVIQKEQEHYSKHSINTRIISIFVCSITLVSIIATAISTVYHHERLMDTYSELAHGVSSMAASFVEGDKIQYYLEEREESQSYQDVKNELQRIHDSNPKIAYLYVYAINEQGAFVVFDTDAPNDEGWEPGTDVSDEQGMTEYMDAFQQGKEIDTDFNDGPYGRMMTVYIPIFDSDGKAVAYAGADIAMASYVNDLLSYIIQVIAVLFALILLVAAFALWYIRQKVTAPIQTIMDQSQEFDRIGPERWLVSDAWKERKQVQTGDEIEELYHTVCKVEENVSHNVNRLIETEQQLRQSQELERINNELARAIEKADEASIAKSEFYSRMSHDMRTPMNGIIGLVNLSEDEDNIQTLHDNMEKIGTASGYLLGLINDTLDMSKLESKKFALNCEPIRVSHFIESISVMIRPSVKQKNLQMHYFNHNIPLNTVFLGDEMRLKQVIMNLVSNAIKFTPVGGEIRMEVSATQRDAERMECQFILSDTGVGMSEEFLEHSIFQPFSQERNAVTREYAGTGLGLAIVKNLVELMHGTIRVESHLNEGTSFTIHAGFDLVDSIVERGPEEAIDLTVLEGKRVLLCEDHPLNTEIATKLLEKAGMTVEHAENGQVGVDLFLRNKQAYYDVILMDIRMPVLDGLEATREIRQLNRPDARVIPIIAMTANAYAEDRQHSQEAGMNAHLTKPINPKIMYQTLAEFLVS